MTQNQSDPIVDNYARLILPDHTELKLPIYASTLGPNMIDFQSIKNLKTPYFSYDPGFMITAACDSRITFIDGEQGILLYRGYPVEQLAQNFDFLTICYLLWHGQLPEPAQKKQFDTQIQHHTLVHDQIRQFFNGFPRTSHPMAMLAATVAALSAFYHESTDIHNPEDREFVMMRLVAKMPTIAAMAYKYSIGQSFIYPNNKFGYSENFLNMLFRTPANLTDPIPAPIINAMEKILILHADHEQNASTATVRLAGSSLADPYACLTAGIAALWGPAHGGANEAVLNMLETIGHPKNIPTFIAKAKDKTDPFRLMGFGHRVYKNFDPRAKIMQQCCYEVLKLVHQTEHHPLLDIALELERIALSDDYFIERKLYPNVDFYSGITLQAMGFPKSLFTVIFAVSRTIGWISHWNEMLSEPTVKIGRPRQRYLGENIRSVTSYG